MTYGEIIDRLNKLQEEYNNLLPFVELLEESREEEGLPPLTDQERAEAEQKVAADKIRAAELDELRFELLWEAESVYGRRPNRWDGGYTF